MNKRSSIMYHFPVILIVAVFFSYTANSQFVSEAEKANPCDYNKRMILGMQTRVEAIEQKYSKAEIYKQIRINLLKSIEVMAAGIEVCDEVFKAIECYKEKENAKPKVTDPTDLMILTGLEKEISITKEKIKGLECDADPNAKPAPGSLAGTPEILGKSRKESYNAVIYTEYTYTTTSAKITMQNDPPDKKVIQWQFDGVPSSLTPGKTYTIYISGSLKMGTPGELQPYPSAGIRVSGLTMVSAQNAYVGINTKRDGKYVITVPLDAKNCSIEIGADYGIGTFARYRYEK